MAPSTSSASTPGANGSATAHRPSIMLCLREGLYSHYLRQLLERSGFQTRSVAPNALEEGVRGAHLVIADARILEEQADLPETVHRTSSRTPIAVVAAAPTREQQAEWAELGVDLILDVALSGQKVVARLRSFLASHTPAATL